MVDHNFVYPFTAFVIKHYFFSDQHSKFSADCAASTNSTTFKISSALGQCPRVSAASLSLRLAAKREQREGHETAGGRRKVRPPQTPCRRPPASSFDSQCRRRVADGRVLRRPALARLRVLDELQRELVAIAVLPHRSQSLSEMKQRRDNWASIGYYIGRCKR